MQFRKCILNLILPGKIFTLMPMGRVLDAISLKLVRISHSLLGFTQYNVGDVAANIFAFLEP
jgi:hypothetical protein